MEILPFETTWMKLEDIKLSEINQKKSNTAWYHLYMKSKKKKKSNSEIESRMMAARGWGTGDMERLWKKCTNFQL